LDVWLMFTLSDHLIRVQSQRAVVAAELDVNQGRVCVGCLDLKRDARS